MNTLPLSFTITSLVPGRRYTPQQIVDAVAAGLRAVTQQQLALFVAGSTEPPSDVGPWAKNGNQWQYYDYNIGRYTDFLISDTQRGFVVSQTQPTDTSVLMWLEIDGSGNPVSIQIRNGTSFLRFPVVIPLDTTAPATPSDGSLYLSSVFGGLLMGRGGVLTSHLIPEGTTAQRPAAAPVGYRYRDTTISRDIIMTAAGWSTVDGGIGDTKFITGISVVTALEYNPGWLEYAGLAGRFPRGYDGSYAVGVQGGRNTFPISGTVNDAAAGAVGNILVRSLSVDGNSFQNTLGTGQNSVGPFNISVLPPFEAGIWLRKTF